MTKAEIEERMAYEKGLFEAVKKYVKNQMTEEQKDIIFKIAQANPVKFEILRENPNYKEIRDKAIARDLLGDALAYDIPISKLNKKFVDKYIADWEKMGVSERYVDNAIKGLKSKFPEQYNMILAQVGEPEINPMEFIYLGERTYQYRNFIISYTNSPISVEVRMF